MIITWYLLIYPVGISQIGAVGRERNAGAMSSVVAISEVFFMKFLCFVILLEFWNVK